MSTTTSVNGFMIILMGCAANVVILSRDERQAQTLAVAVSAAAWYFSVVHSTPAVAVQCDNGQC
jgi:hypothetical protein